jgi:hypothetical protein
VLRVPPVDPVQRQLTELPPFARGMRSLRPRWR